MSSKNVPVPDLGFNKYFMGDKLPFPDNTKLDIDFGNSEMYKRRRRRRGGGRGYGFDEGLYFQAIGDRDGCMPASG